MPAPDAARAAPRPIACAVLGEQGVMATSVSVALAARPDLHSVERLPARDLRPLAAWLATAPPRAVVVDFTHPECTAGLLRLLADAAPCGLVSGTSGLDAAGAAAARQAAARHAVFRASNFSVGAALQRRLAELLARIAPGHAQADILDLHHARKAETVSATAHQLQDGWEAVTGVRPPVASMRQGDGISEHTLFVSMPGERLELAHRLLGRHAFMSGIAAAVDLVARAAPGLYGMSSLLDPSSVEGRDSAA